MKDYLITDDTLTKLANSIREKTGSTEPIIVNEMPEAIASISSGGGGETCTLSIVTGSLELGSYVTIFYLNKDSALSEITFELVPDYPIINILKNSLFYTDWSFGIADNNIIGVVPRKDRPN